jgi:hypothetical protein
MLFRHDAGVFSPIQYMHKLSWVPHKSGSTWSRTTSSILLLRQFEDQKPNQTTPNVAEWRGLMSRTFLLVAGLTDLGDLGRYLGPKQRRSRCFCWLSLFSSRDLGVSMHWTTCAAASLPTPPGKNRAVEAHSRNHVPNMPGFPYRGAKWPVCWSVCVVKKKGAPPAVYLIIPARHHHH